ncbi:MHS family proline/betaine transporter-like MFS transporter [Nocardioides luteus]|uniref:MFS transporter n=1 Tax=Nocardioides luteus TaxID=1844 RepID=A0ABQ5T353_9ACTN|nr:MFS transporter [Nocardioides luteus]MDR7310209.1 MHS family proline/betaine transporter-like MFS transporter [Nocardioides luteus]GGR69573.1 MFS transporter [Nocardioides luteus]GLJ70323.1 MFS transporter [Nocardioides luteus]
MSGTPSTPSTEEQPDKSKLRRAITGSAVGNATEWFDYGAYAYVATEMTDNFFPEYGFVGTALVFAISFILRPLGGLFWGPIGDRIGRQRVLALTIVLMAGATFCVGLLPTYHDIGVWAVVLLVLLRVIQGFSTGGEYGGAATYMAETAPDKRRGFYGSFLEFGTIVGFTAAIAVVFITETIIGPDAMTEWGWRIPFLIGGPIGLVGLYIRTKLEETPVFQELEADAHVEGGAVAALKDLLSLFWRPVLTLIGLVAALNIANYTLLTYMPTYLTETAGFDSADADLLVIFGQVAMLIFIPIAGALSDKIGRKPMWAGSFIGLIVLAVPMFLLISQGFWPAVLGFSVLGIVYVAQLATISATFPAMFPSQVRYGGMAISYNISTAAFGGTALYVNDALIKGTGNNLMPAFYMMAASVVGLVALFFVVETAGKSIRGTEIPGTPESEAELEELDKTAEA